MAYFHHVHRTGAAAVVADVSGALGHAGATVCRYLYRRVDADVDSQFSSCFVALLTSSQTRNLLALPGLACCAAGDYAEAAL
jgi:hypothetical protein